VWRPIERLTLFQGHGFGPSVRAAKFRLRHTGVDFQESPSGGGGLGVAGGDGGLEGNEVDFGSHGGAGPWGGAGFAGEGGPAGEVAAGSYREGEVDGQGDGAAELENLFLRFV
jgi:hypothetical protein